MKREKMAYRLKKELDAARYAHTLGVEKTAREMAEKFGVDEEKAALAEDTPLGRLGTPEDDAELIAFLASRRAGFITGQVIGCDGGFS